MSTQDDAYMAYLVAQLAREDREAFEEGFKVAKQMAMRRCAVWMRPGSPEDIRPVAEALHDAIRMIEPPA